MMSLATVENGGMSLGNRLQAIRADAGAFTASQTKDVTVNWPVPFPDGNYTLIIELQDAASTGQSDANRQVVGVPTGVGFVVRISAGTSGYSAGQLFIHAIAMHD